MWHYILFALIIVLSAWYLFLRTPKSIHNDASLPPLPSPDPTLTAILLSKLQGQPEDWNEFDNPAIREKALISMIEKNGKTFLLHCQGDVKNALGTSPVIATADPQLVKQIFLKKKHSTRRPRRMLLAQHLPGLDGILFQDGPKWERHSRTLKPVFHAKNFTQFTTKMREEATKHIEMWSTINQNSPISTHHLGEGRIAALSSLRELSTSVALHVGYGIDPECEEGAALRVALDGYDEKKRFRAAGQNICLLIKALFLVWMDARRIRNVVTKIVARIQGEEEVKMKEEKKKKTAATNTATNTINTTTNTTTDTTTNTTTTDATTTNNNTTTTNTTNNEKPETLSWIRQMVRAKFSILELSNEVGHLHHAHKAIAYMTSFALYELGKHPIWQENMCQEFETVLENGRAPEKSDLSSLKICTSIWKETLRLHPISLGVIREVGEDVETEVHGEMVTIPKGTMVSILLYALHMDKDAWKSPEQFNPQRWIECDNTSAQSTMSDKGIRESFVPFLDGKRQCEGRFLAELEFVVFMWCLLKQHRVQVPDDYTFSIGPDFFPNASTPIPLMLVKRE